MKIAKEGPTCAEVRSKRDWMKSRGDYPKKKRHLAAGINIFRTSSNIGRDRSDETEGKGRRTCGRSLLIRVEKSAGFEMGAGRRRPRTFTDRIRQRVRFI
jgi:hypothetical protein